MAGKLNLDFDEKSTRVLEFTWEIDGEPVDLTGYTAQATGKKRGRRRVAGESSLLFDLTDGDGIELGGATGVFLITFTDELVGTFDVGGGTWELVAISPGGERYSLLKGTVGVDPKVVE